MSMGRPSLREKILEAGVTVVHERGFAQSGIREITGAAGAPQGSFTNHFTSKEAFGLAVLDRYVERTQAIMDATLRDPGRPPLERLRAYFDAIAGLLQDAGWRYGCLVGNMGLEAAEHSEPLRERLSRAFAELQEPFAATLAAAQAAGDIRTDVAADELAGLLLSAWYGAMLRMKVDRSPVALGLFRQVFLATLLARPSAAPDDP
jgi:TetR/AcrR family transcriptional repressor of nem operon